MKGALARPVPRKEAGASALGKWLPNFELALTGFSDAVIRRKGLTGDQESVVAAVTDYLLAVHSRIPDYLRLPFRVLVLLFDASPLPVRGRPFHRLDGDQRIAWIGAWERSRLEVCRRLMEMYGSLAMFGIYAELYGQDYEYEPAAVPNPVREPHVA